MAKDLGARLVQAGLASRQQLAEAQELLRSNQQVIQWLNKELNDAQTGQRVHTAGASLMAAQSTKVAAFRPAMPLLSQPSAGPDVSVGMLASSTGVGPFDSVGSKPTTATSAAPGSAMSGLRSRAGLAFVEKGSAGSDSTSEFNKYLSPSKTSPSKTGVY